MSDQSAAVTPQEKRSLFYSFVRVLAWIIFRILYPVKYHHTERVNRSGPFIMISNHYSLLDPLILALPVKKREVTYLAKKELGSNPVGAWVMKNLHAILVDRHNSDMKAMRACLTTLNQGRILGFFPEGTRHKHGLMEEIEEGLPLIALRSGVPVVPVLISQKPRLFRLTHCYMGEEILIQDLMAQGVNKETCQQMMDRMRKIYREMMNMHQKNIHVRK